MTGLLLNLGIEPPTKHMPFQLTPTKNMIVKPNLSSRRKRSSYSVCTGKGKIVMRDELLANLFIIAYVISYMPDVDLTSDASALNRAFIFNQVILA
ncbi:Uncharacterized protein HZ326_26042 [Fusarium oxysporum f. sp. albedinis]|nr:Uncharacterized protein HZ326_26042 [Fusarium oxysporum f. sp. albedinis]